MQASFNLGGARRAVRVRPSYLDDQLQGVLQGRAYSGAF